MRRTYLIGDIHGCLKELLTLESVAFDHARTAFVPRTEVRFVSVGDLIDRGPDSAAVVEHYLRGAKSKTHRAVYGNHEAMMIAVFWDQRPDLMREAGLGTQKSGSALAWDLKEEFLRKRDQLQEAGIHSAADFIEHETFNWIIQGGRETLQSMGCVPHRPESWRPALPILKYLAKLPLYWRNARAVVTHALLPRAELGQLTRKNPRLGNPPSPS
ncbi:MAG: metallophosphoesterase, partial [Bdellovibrionota bacterium]